MVVDFDYIEVYDSDYEKLGIVTIDEYNREEKTVKLNPNDKKAIYFTGYRNEENFEFNREFDECTIDMYEKVMVILIRKLIVKFRKVGGMIDTK